MALQLSIIIVNYNVRELLLKCLMSIRQQHFQDVEIFVVDNHSSDGSVEAVRSQFPEVQVISNATNVGFPAANNQAIRLAKGQFIFLLNPDTELKINNLNRLIDYMLEHKNVSVLAPRLLNTDGSIQFSIQHFIRIRDIIAETFYLHLLLSKGRTYYRKPIVAVMEVEAASGAALLVRREVFDKIGLLDEELFWTEDMEFCYRAFKHGLKTVYLPDVEIIHHGGASGKQNLNVMISSQVLTKITFFRKNHSKLEFFTACFFRLLHILSRLIILFFVSLLIPQFRNKLSAYAFTLKQFLRGNF